MDLGGWLRSLGLEQYEAIFRENAIDAEVLPDLTDQDLEKLGVLLGHRRKMLRAIANLDNLPATAAPAPSAPVAPSPSVAAAIAPPAQEVAGERRYLTVLFCDLVGSTSISAQLDAED